MSIDQDTLDILSQSAVLAGQFGLTKEADTIVAAIMAVSPDDENAAILKAVTQLNARRHEDALKTLRDGVLAKNPDNTAAKAFLAATFHALDRQADYARLRQEVIDADDDAEAVKLVNSLADG